MNMVIGVGFAVLAYLLIMAFYPFKPVTINEISTTKKTYYRGESLDVVVDICKNMESDADIIFELRSENPKTYTTLGAYKTSGPAGECRRFIDNTMIIPEIIKPGIYYVEIIATYHISHIRDVQYFLQAGEIEIL